MLLALLTLHPPSPAHAEESPVAFAGVVGTLLPAADEAALATLLSQWLSAQNTGDFARYRALYASTFEGVRRSADRERVMRLAEWLKDRERMFKKPMAVQMSEIYVSALDAHLQVDFLQSWSSGGFADLGPKRLKVAKEAGVYRIQREDMLASFPASDGAPTPRPKRKPAGFAVVAGLYPSPEAAATALTKYTTAGYPTHGDYPKVVPATELSIPFPGQALLVGKPRLQQVAALLADFTTRLGSPTFLWPSDNPETETLFLIRVAPHRVDISDVPILKKQLGGKVPPLHWEIHQTCNGCGILEPRGRSVAAKDTSVVIPYTIHPQMDKRGAYLTPDFPESLETRKSEWQDCGYTFGWKDVPAPYFEVGKEIVTAFAPVSLRLGVNECGD